MPRTLSPAEKAELKEQLKAAFALFDSDGSGCIESKEFENVVGEYNKSCKGQKVDAKQAAADFIALADKNADNKVNFEEFFEFMVKAIELCEC